MMCDDGMKKGEGGRGLEEQSFERLIKTSLEDLHASFAAFEQRGDLLTHLYSI